ncbi:hypothetical protein EMPS_06554 [Entomortierella parvispora]|uniref:Tyrosine specific protein phosphatases domain-containing protein n=1 Tax=Entomortierella parvispora TaxID=205924 RepID=A0A9P3HCG0_9FUNG|nr:hypothetical protein EMPS_06554 [Entomortierella parvispora]
MAQLQRLLSRAPPPSELQSQVPATYYKPAPVSFKDSISHPINVSWIIPPWVSALLQKDMKVPKFGSPIHFEGHERDETGLTPFTSLFDFAQQQAAALKQEGPDGAIGRAKMFYPDWRPRGNLGLSSCPGKKVRLDGPVNGRAKIVRDLDMDFDRLRQLGFTRVVCCLFDEELELLGSPFSKYLEAATRNGLDVVRIPMVEGSTPYSFAEMEKVLDRIDETTKRGENVLVHCRGGVGRAAVVACCWLLRLRYFQDYVDTVEWVRAQRSPKAIETREQMQFVAGFQLWDWGGSFREDSLVVEREIQHRIDMTEANVKEERKEAARMNSVGHHRQRPLSHSSSSQQQHQEAASRRSLDQSRRSMDSHSMQERNGGRHPVGELIIDSPKSRSSSIPSTAAVSSIQSQPVSPSSLSGARRSLEQNGHGHDHHSDRSY